MSKRVPYQKRPHQESKKGALSRNLKKSLKKRLIKNLHKKHKLTQTYTNLHKLYKKPHQESKEGVLSRNLIKSLKATNKASLRVY